MGGKKKGGGSHNFGRALIKDRFGRSNKTLNSDSFVSITFAIVLLSNFLILIFCTIVLTTVKTV